MYPYDCYFVFNKIKNLDMEIVIIGEVSRTKLAKELLDQRN
jgi:hypothetical protein